MKIEVLIGQYIVAVGLYIANLGCSNDNQKSMNFVLHACMCTTNCTCVFDCIVTPINIYSSKSAVYYDGHHTLSTHLVQFTAAISIARYKWKGLWWFSIIICSLAAVC